MSNPKKSSSGLGWLIFFAVVGLYFYNQLPK